MPRRSVNPNENRNKSTKIEWTDHTWNPFVGCSKVSDGCRNCYAIDVAALYGHKFVHYEGVARRSERGTPNWTGQINLAPDHILNKRFKPDERVFVNSMSDFWHEYARDEWRQRVLNIMRENPRVQYQVLTKRPENIAPMLERMGEAVPKNMWVGSTVESSRVLDRIDTLRQIPAAIRFLSIEPLLDDIAVNGLNLEGIHWVIVGGESGRHCRPMRAEWVRKIREECARQNVPFFFKQWGNWRNNPLSELAFMFRAPARWVKERDPHGKAGGALLDGNVYHVFPEHQYHDGSEPPKPARRYLTIYDLIGENIFDETA